MRAGFVEEKEMTNMKRGKTEDGAELESGGIGVFMALFNIYTDRRVWK